MAERAARRPLAAIGIPALAAVTAALFLFATIYAYVELILTSVTDDAGRLSGSNWAAAFTASYLLLTPLLHSLAVGAAAALTATAFGGFLAWIAVRTDLPGGRGVLPFVAVPHIIPGFQLASSWVLIFTRGGLWQALLTPRVPLPAYGGVAIWLVLTLHLSVFVRRRRRRAAGA